MITEKSGNFVVLISDNLVEGNKCMYLLLKRKSYVQTDATTPNIVGPTTLGVVASVLVVLCKRMQQLPTMLGPAVHCGKDTTQKTWRPCVTRVRGPNNVGRAVQTDPILLRYALVITEQEILGAVGSKV